MARKQGVSPELDQLSCDLMGTAFDRLAEGDEVNVLLVVQDGAGNVATYEFADDGVEACLEGARHRVEELVQKGGDPAEELAAPVRYALTYEGAVADESGAYQDALLLEFGEEGYTNYSAYSYFRGRGQGDGFQWSDPAAAGEVEPLL